jgi:hypothetical protein
MCGVMPEFLHFGGRQIVDVDQLGISVMFVVGVFCHIVGSL